MYHKNLNRKRHGFMKKRIEKSKHHCDGWSEPGTQQ